MINQKCSQLSQEEFERLKEYIFEHQKRYFKRSNVKIIKKSFGFQLKKETNKLLYDFDYYLLLHCKTTQH